MMTHYEISSLVKALAEEADDLFQPDDYDKYVERYNELIRSQIDEVEKKHKRLVDNLKANEECAEFISNFLDEYRKKRERGIDLSGVFPSTPDIEQVFSDRLKKLRSEIRQDHFILESLEENARNLTLENTEKLEAEFPKIALGDIGDYTDEVYAEVLKERRSRHDNISRIIVLISELYGI